MNFQDFHFDSKPKRLIGLLGLVLICSFTINAQKEKYRNMRFLKFVFAIT